ncbi:nuclease-related domain-containing protein [Oscillibacter sp.]|uniref:nuclease-related domain-containing protein n=1 Tax=Oscillibacter sp. TaxID=1945593 RepID=UPI00257EF6B9|nr:nuclease-related domain-containing protein [Oscillibacter sp.]
MAKLIGRVRSSNFGENLFITKAQEFLDDHYIIYWNRQIFGREFDVCILMPGKGILVVELKGWREENILRIENSDTIIIKTDEGEIPATPQKQARGYRFAIERHIRQNIGKYPLVFQTVCLPRSQNLLSPKRLDVVLDEPFTILKEDLEDTNSFYKKIDQALSEANHWKRTPFDSKTMLEVRHIFECDIEPDENDAISDEQNSTDYHNEHDYSRFYFLGSGSSLDSVLDEMISQYIQGCKLYGVVATSQQLTQVAMALDAALTDKGLVRNRDSIELDFDRSTPHNPEVSENMTSFMAFHCSLSVLAENISDLPSIFVFIMGSFPHKRKRG